MGGTNNVPKAKKISRTNVAHLREPTKTRGKRQERLWPHCPLPSTPSSPTSPSKAKAAKGSKGRGKGGKGDKKGGRGTKRGRANAAHEADGAEEVNWEDQEAEYDYSDEEPQNAKRARDTVEVNNSESELLGIDWY